MNSFEITLNSLEHYVFCPYRWWLVYVENEWIDNIHTTLGNIIHAKVDDPTFVEKRGAVLTKRSVPLSSQELNLYGVADLVEFIGNKGEENYKINIVEYKKGIPNEAGQVQDFDGLQLYAQMLCMREMTGVVVNGYIYYDAIRRRVQLKDEEKFDKLLRDTLKQMRDCVRKGFIPNKNVAQHCRACSMNEICLPKIKV